MENAGPGSRGAGSRGTGSPGVDNAGSDGKRMSGGRCGVWWKTRGLVGDARSNLENTGYNYFSSKYELSSLN